MRFARAGVPEGAALRIESCHLRLPCVDTEDRRPLKTYRFPTVANRPTAPATRTRTSPPRFRASAWRQRDETCVTFRLDRHLKTGKARTRHDRPVGRRPKHDSRTAFVGERASRDVVMARGGGLQTRPPVRGPQVKTWPWCSSLSSMPLTAAVSPRSLPRSSTG